MKKSATVLVCAMLAGAVQAGTTYRCTDGVGTVTVTQDGCGPDTVTMETDDGTRGPASIRLDEADAPHAASPAPVAPLAPVEEKQEKLIFYDLSQTDIVAIRSGLASVLKDLTAPGTGRWQQPPPGIPWLPCAAP